MRVSTLKASRRPISGRLCIGNGDIISCWFVKKFDCSVCNADEFGEFTADAVDVVPSINSGMLCPKLSCPCFKMKKKNNRCQHLLATLFINLIFCPHFTECTVGNVHKSIDRVFQHMCGCRSTKISCNVFNCLKQTRTYIEK